MRLPPPAIHQRHAAQRRAGRHHLQRPAEAFEFKPGPVFTNFLLADEINRATPKTQSALLEAMNENTGDRGRPVLPSAAALHGDCHAEPGGASRDLSAAGVAAGPFPDAHSHRLSGRRGEREILRNIDTLRGAVRRCSRARTAPAGAGGGVRVDESLVDYMLAIVEKTRAHESLALGVSPRGAQALFRAAQSLALWKAATMSSPTTSSVWCCPCSRTAWW